MKAKENPIGNTESRQSWHNHADKQTIVNSDND